jgi:Protein of unknown function (DUF2971)
MTSEVEKTKKLSQIFFSYSEKRREKLFENELEPSKEQNYLAHYTTAENALKIIKSKTLWFRNTQFMDDYSEVVHGQEMLRQYLQNDNFANRDKLQNALSKVDSSVDELNNFNSLWAQVRQDTYICCFSEHEPKDHAHGRLSMWRGFGKGTAAVALIFKAPAGGSTTTPVILSPVSYAKYEDFAVEFNQLVQNIENNQEYLKNVDPSEITRWVYWVLVMAVVSLKHSSFEEEQEWRLLYLPTHTSAEKHKLESKIESIGAIPQLIYQFKFQDSDDSIELNEIIERVIIGPSQYAAAIREALVIEMTNSGIENAENKIFFSNIPLR